MIGSHQPLNRLGKPTLCGRSGNVTETPAGVLADGQPLHTVSALPGEVAGLRQAEAIRLMDRAGWN